MIRETLPSVWITRRQAITTALFITAIQLAIAAMPGQGAAQPTGAVSLYFLGDIKPFYSPLKQSGDAAPLMDLIFNRLVKSDDKFQQQPDLAERFEVSPDARVFTFHLRRGVKWTDGQPFTAKDVLFTYRLALTKAAVALQAGKLMQIKGGKDFNEGKTKDITGLEAPDDYTVKITLERPNVAFFGGLSFNNAMLSILPEHVLRDMDPAKSDSHPYFTKPDVTTGPYQFVRHVADQYIELKANPSFFLGSPKIEKVFIRFAERATALALFERGDIDVMVRITAKDAERLQGNPRFSIVPVPGVGVYQLSWNNERFTDKRVRQAFMYAIDREALVKVVHRGQARLVHSTVIGPEWATYDDLNTYKYNPTKAKELLREAGWDPARPVEIIYIKGVTDIELAAPIVQQQLKEVGMQLVLRTFDTPTWINRVMSTAEFDMAWYSGGVYGMDPDVSANYYECANWTPRGSNTGHYCNKELGDLFAQGRGTPDVAKRKEIYHKVAKILNEDVPTVFLWSDNAIFGINKRITGVKPGPNYYIWWNLHEWAVSP